jgi:hypothetical protein
MDDNLGSTNPGEVRHKENPAVLCVCVYNPKALQREFVRPNSRRVEKRLVMSEGGRQEHAGMGIPDLGGVKCLGSIHCIPSPYLALL